MIWEEGNEIYTAFRTTSKKTLQAMLLLISNYRIFIFSCKFFNFYEKCDHFTSCVKILNILLLKLLEL